MMQPATFLKFYVHHTFVKVETATEFKGIGMLTKHSF